MSRVGVLTRSLAAVACWQLEPPAGAGRPEMNLRGAPAAETAGVAGPQSSGACLDTSPPGGATRSAGWRSGDGLAQSRDHVGFAGLPGGAADDAAGVVEHHHRGRAHD